MNPGSHRAAAKQAPSRRKEAAKAPAGNGRSEATELERLVPYLVFRISRRLNANLRERMRHEGVTIHRWRVLSVLATSQECSLTDVAQFTVMEQSVISRVADQMVRDGLLKRGVKQADRRAATLSLTARGKALFNRLWPLYSEHGRRAVDSLTAIEQRELVRMLQKVLAGVQEGS